MFQKSLVHYSSSRLLKSPPSAPPLLPLFMLIVFFLQSLFLPSLANPFIPSLPSPPPLPSCLPHPNSWVHVSSAVSERGITSHGRLADWPCPALPGIHTAAQLIQLAWLSVETSGIVITKMMYFNPTNSIQRAKALMIYVHVCVCACVCRNVCIFFLAFIFLKSHIWTGSSAPKRMWDWAMQSRTSKN